MEDASSRKNMCMQDAGSTVGMGNTWEIEENKEGV